MLILGTEIECIINPDKFITKEFNGGYGFRNGKNLNSFWVETYDASVYSSNIFPSEKCLEIIQKPISEVHFQESLNAFKDLFSGELSDCVYFNKSCGAHIHFSLPKKLVKYFTFEKFKRFREMFFNNLENSGLRADLIADIRKQYFRDYAKEVKTETEFNKIINDLKNSNYRKYEINLTCEEGGKGIEWRSFNLMNVKTWDEFFKMYDIALKTIQDFIQVLTKSQEVSSYNFGRIDKKLLKEKLLAGDYNV